MAKVPHTIIEMAAFVLVTILPPYLALHFEVDQPLVGPLALLWVFICTVGYILLAAQQ